MHRFRVYAPLEAGMTRVPLDPDEAHFAGKVLRLRSGDTVEVFSGNGAVGLGNVLFLPGSRIEVDLRDVQQFPRNARQVHLAAGQPKPGSGATGRLVQTACELGASSLHLFRGQLSQGRSQDKSQKWAKVAREALRVSKGAWATQVFQWDSLAAFLAGAQDPGPLLACFEDERGTPLLGVAELLGSCTLVIGPEGGLGDEEVRQLSARRAIPVTLGTLVLRTEVAALCALSGALLAGS